MPEERTIAALLLVIGPVLGAIPIANPRLMRVWSMSRLDHITTVGANRRGWVVLNAGFVLATVATTAGLLILAVDWGGTGNARAILLTGVVAYAFGGVLWCVVLAARARTTPALADLLATGSPTEPGEALLGASLGGLFQAFVLVTAGALVAVGIALVIGGGVAPAVAWFAIVTGVAAAALLVATGDVVPALLYPPTALVGAALLAGWT